MSKELRGGISFLWGGIGCQCGCLGDIVHGLDRKGSQAGSGKGEEGSGSVDEVKQRIDGAICLPGENTRYMK